MNNIKKLEKIFKKICETLDLGTIEEITYIKSSQNLVYKIKTDKKEYYIKQYSKDSIKNEKDLLNRKRQVVIAEKLSQNGVPAIIPISFNNRYFIKYNRDYYLLFNYRKEQPITDKDLSNKKIRKLATTLAIIHKLNIKSNLNCQYKKIKIDFTKYLKKYSKLDNSLFNTLNNNFLLLDNLIINCNKNIPLVKEHLCVSHNDYKLKNIIWDKDYMYLIDFDASAMSNPTVSFAEAAFALSLQDKKLNKNFYKEFVSSYIKKYGKVETDFETALNVSMNGKLQWLEYLMSQCSKRKPERIKDTISMINELRLFIDNQELMLETFNDLTKTKKEKKANK